MSLARLAAPILRWPFRQRWLAQRLFGVPLAPLEPEEHDFDLATPFLGAEATRRIPRPATVVDLGCGPFAVVGRALESRCEARVVCADVNPPLIERARAAGPGPRRGPEPQPPGVRSKLAAPSGTWWNDCLSHR